MSCESSTSVSAARCGNTPDWPRAVPVQNAVSTCCCSTRASASPATEPASATPTGEHSNSAYTVNGVAPRNVCSTLPVLAGGSGGAPPVPVTARHSSYVVSAVGQCSIQVTPCCQFGGGAGC